uniref:Chitin-binding type-2 domain-containing protein n=1 Tax=Macrostomum lignano TaxID=282301 RepID=A0A1I8F2J5_9PLAT
LPLPPPPQPPQQQPAPTQAPVATQPQPQLQQKKPASVCRYPDLQFQCRDITKAPHCIAIYDRCDGIVHCGDGSDEAACSSAGRRRQTIGDRRTKRGSGGCQPATVSAYDAPALRRLELLRRVAATAPASQTAGSLGRRAATAAADPPWRPRSSGRAAEIGELDLPSGRRAKQRARPAATEAPLRDSSRKSTPSKPQPPKPSKRKKRRAASRPDRSSRRRAGRADGELPAVRTQPWSRWPWAWASAWSLWLFLTCRIRQLRARFRRAAKR